MGLACPDHEKCFVSRLRKECADARILVVNHHLLFADMAARSQGAGYDATVVLPPYRRVIIDEAHNIETAATSFFSEEFSRISLYRQLGRLYRRRGAQTRGLIPRILDIAYSGAAPQERLLQTQTRLDAILEEMDAARTDMDEIDRRALDLCRYEGVFRLHQHTGVIFRDSDAGHLDALRRRILKVITRVQAIIDIIEEKGPGSDVEPSAAIWETKAVLRRLTAIADTCSVFTSFEEHGDKVCWIERAGSSAAGREPFARFTASPLDVAPGLADALWEPNKTVVCVSATLTISDHFDYWMSRSGLSLVETTDGRPILSGCYPSPFPYDTEALLAVPADAPLPEAPEFRPYVDNAVGDLALAAGGSALILFTSYEAMRSAWADAAPRLEEAGLRVMKQGDDDRSRLLSAFLADHTSVLFATDSFWEGVDAPGDALRLVILCRLPFRTPTEPVFEARCELLQKQGLSPFMALSLPEAVMKFKQGFGRLMRRKTDRGVVAVLDGRLLRKSYGRTFLQSIPETCTCFEEMDTVLRKVERFLG
jgi:ATP-dependent DNA helicase DinG